MITHKGSAPPPDWPGRAMAKLTPLSRDSTPSLVAARIRAAIVDGSLPAGMQLAEIALAERLGVSRGPIREALQRLIQEGLLRGERHRGVFVPALDDDDVADVYLMRELVECDAAGRLATSDGPNALTSVEASLGHLRRAVGAGSWVRVVEADLEFHESLVATVGSRRLSRSFQTVLAETRLCLHRLEAFYPRHHDVVAEHEAIAVALRAHQGPKAVRLLSAHMQESIARLTGRPAGRSAAVTPGPLPPRASVPRAARPQRPARRPAPIEPGSSTRARAARPPDTG
ncbi:MAG TPA: GntR family transcriptional regulator [Verrucomicrobiae bacterium]|nr:GntR family transcriptional regulator [Verrucomicrobiae bacterium]